GAAGFLQSPPVFPVHAATKKALAAFQRLVADAVRLVGVGAEALLLVHLVILEIALEPFDMAVALERHDMGRDAVEEPAIMADHDRAAGKIQKRLPQGPQR